MTRLALSVFGPVRVMVDGEPASGFESNKVRALLIYLAVEADRPHSRDVLAGLLWPEFPERAALSNLRYALSNLRQVIGDRDAQPPFLLTSSDTLQFNTASDYSFDVHDFMARIASDQIDQLQRAVDLYRGAFLEGFAIADSAAFEEWITLNREHCSHLMIQTLRRLVEHHERCAEYEQAQQYAWRQVELEPWQEEGHQQLMRCLAYLGQRSAALAQFETCRRLLANELGVEPGAETIALYERIRDGLLIASPVPVAQPPAFLGLQTQTAEIERPLFVARETELARLDGFLDRALNGRGQVVFVTGEPGSGKTMLVQEFIRRSLATHPDLIAVSGSCNAYTGIGDPYLPFLEMLDLLTGDVEARWAGGVISQEHARRLWILLPEVVQALIDDGPELIDRFVLGSALLARVQAGAHHLMSRLDDLVKRSASGHLGSGQQTDLFDQYTKVLHTLARQRPLLLIADDLQWADTGSISLLFHLGRRLAGQRILVVGAYRPGEVAAGWDGERHPLEPVINEFQRDFGDNRVDLSQAEGRQFVDALLDSEPNHLGTDFRETLYRHTGGHSLFTVELLRGLQARGDVTKDEAGWWVESPSLDWDILPPRIEAVIAESVNRLPQILQTTLAIASVEGEFFTAQVVAQVQGEDAQEIIRRLSGPLSKQHRLVTAAGFQRLDGQRASRYRFRHFLFQKYLYNRLDEVERAHLHEALGSALEALYGEETPELAAQLAWHFEAADLTARAVKYLQLAGDRAVRLSANTEALAHYRHALRLLSALPDTPERASQELRARIALRIPLEVAQGYTSAELEQNNIRARELARQVPDSPDLFWVLLGLGVYDNLHLSLTAARELGDEVLALAGRLEDAKLMLSACQLRSLTALYEGQLDAYFGYRQQAHFLYDREQHRDLAFQLDADTEVAGLSHAGWAYWIQGYPDLARQQGQDAIAWAEEIGHPFSLAFARFFAGKVHNWCRDVPMTRTLAEQTIALSQEHGMVIWLGAGYVLNGYVLVEQGQMAEGIGQLEHLNASYRDMGAEMQRVLQIPVLADAYARAGRAAEGLALLEDGLQVALDTGYRMIEPDLYRSKGDLLLVSGSPEEAEACFQQAIESARQIAARSWELRAALSLCRLWQGQGKAQAAHDLLSSIYGWFTEGFDTADLQEARVLLDDLSAQRG